MTEREAYLENDDASKARVLEMVKLGQTLKVELAALDKELTSRVRSWMDLGQAYRSDLGDTVFHVGETEIAIQRPYPKGRSREIIQKGDLAAYDALLSADVSRIDEIEIVVEEMYRKFAIALDVDPGLPPIT